MNGNRAIQVNDEKLFNQIKEYQINQDKKVTIKIDYDKILAVGGEAVVFHKDVDTVVKSIQITNRKQNKSGDKMPENMTANKVVSDYVLMPDQFYLQLSDNDVYYYLGT